MTYPQTWRLDTLLQGKSTDIYCREWLHKLAALIKEIEVTKDFASCLLTWQELSASLKQISSYADCLFAENTANPEAQSLSARIVELQGLFQKVSLQVDHKLLTYKNFDALIMDPRLIGLSFPMHYRREVLRQKMDLKSESIATDLAMFGYHSWNEFYKQAISRFQITLTTKEAAGTYTFSQVDNLMAHPSREVRSATFSAIQERCKEHETSFAEALRSIYGFRLQLYRHRGWQNPFHEALYENRMQPSTLKTMFESVKEKADPFHHFLEAKAKLLGVDKLSWYDLEAPFPESEPQIAYDEGAKIIIEAFQSVSPEMAQFAKQALVGGWIDAENRPGKAPGAFCATVPLSQESRVFMNYSGTLYNVFVLAHELGHAYHNHVTFDLPEMTQNYPMTLAETASTTAELIVFDALLSRCKTKEERKRLLYEKAMHSTIYFLNIRARFLFEERLFHEFPKGYIGAREFSEMMLDAQKESFGNTLETYHPYFWLTKAHFFFTELPSYNFPYTFGYSLSLAIMAKAKADPAWFSGWFKGFLQDTGRMTVEAIVKKHFGEELDKSLFWNRAIDSAIQDVEEYLSL